MLQRGVKPDVVTFSTLIRCASVCSLPHKSVELFERMPSFGCEPDHNVSSSMIYVYARTGNVDMALKLYDDAKNEKWPGLLAIQLTAVFKNLHPPSCAKESSTCIGPTAGQMTFLFSGFCLLLIGAAGIRPCNLAFGVDQFNPKTESGKKGINSFFNWYYFTFTFAQMISLSLIVYVQSSVSWAIGLGIPAALMLLACVLFFMGDKLYVKVKPSGSPIKSIVQVLVVAVKKRRVKLPAQHPMLSLFDYVPSKCDYPKLPHTYQFRLCCGATFMFAVCKVKSLLLCLFCLEFRYAMTVHDTSSHYGLDSGFYMSSFTATIFVVSLVTLGVLLITLLVSLVIMLQSCQSKSTGVIELVNMNNYYSYCRVYSLHAEINRLERYDLPNICRDLTIHYIKGGHYAKELNLIVSMIDDYFKNLRPSDNGLDVVLLDIDDIVPPNSYQRFHRDGISNCVKEAKHVKLMFVLRLYMNLQTDGWPIILVSREPEMYQNVTINHLVSAGFRGWSSLMMRTEDSESTKGNEYFSR
ncbi:unnamed protein product [Vicia faba]|uniref:Uncharacterized protein n=1 Tax=Vicia faba TaxID=3906 RepID=A0AAV1AKI5_VICFA|nr:unnamed protein product [Vicia faba]